MKVKEGSMIRQLLGCLMILISVTVGLTMTVSAESLSSNGGDLVNKTKLTAANGNSIENPDGYVETVPYKIEDGVLTLGGGTISKYSPYPWLANSVRGTIHTVIISGKIILKDNAARYFFKGLSNTTKIDVLLRQVLVLKKLAVYPNPFGVIPVNVIFNSED
jgi:hypothetical protein